ncbi:MAG: 2-oxoglutarate synthase subunit alpha [Campylobacteraceae bacterium 4484_166]|nr:MAG: 2-oxoglutarate synthase subunit alpha [Campylobacteraceae bacterium 4484_166]
MSKREIISTGNELSAIAAVDAGCEFFGGYPLTPSSEVMHVISDLLPKKGGVAIQMEDEIAGICCVIGAAMTGKRAMTATSGPGMSLKAENLGLAQMAEVPLVCVNVMRGGPSTGLPTRVSQGDVKQASNPSHGDYRSITLSAGNLEECYTEVVRAFNLADRFMQPVIVLTDETIGHMHGKAMIPTQEDVAKGIVPRKVFTGDPKDYFPYECGPTEPATLNPMFTGYRYHYTGLHHDKNGFPTEEINTCRKLIQRLEDKVMAHQDEIELNEEFMCDDLTGEKGEVLIIAYGSVSLAAKEAIKDLRKEGIKAGLFRPITLWPSPAKRIKELTQKIKNVLVVELNIRQYTDEIERVSSRLDIEGLYKVNGRAIAPIEIIEKVKEVF